MRRAFERAAEAPSASIALRVDATGVESFAFAVSGTYDRPRRLLRATVDLGDDASAVAPGGRITLIGRGDRVYVHLPILSGAVGGRPWLAGSAADVSRRLGRSLGVGAATSWPEAFAEILRGLGRAARLHKTGESSNGPVPTTTYGGTMDLEALDLADLRDELGVEGLPAQAWLDGEGRLRRVAIDAAGTSSEGTKWSIRGAIDMRAYGARVDAAPPPAAQTSDLADVFGRVRSFTVPFQSMEPTLHCARPGVGCLAARKDKFVVDTRGRAPVRGDVVVFTAPPIARDRCGAAGTYVKRVVGLPGETIEERLVEGRGYVFVDGTALREPYLEAARRDSRTYGPARVPRGRYFLMGDNRSQSCDSREWGAVPRSSIIGRLVLISRDGRLFPPPTPGSAASRGGRRAPGS